MAQSEFTKLCAEIRQRWPAVANICVHHRLGCAAPCSRSPERSSCRSVQPFYLIRPSTLLSPAIKIYTFALQVGGGGPGQRCHGDLVSTPPRWPAGGAALHHPAEGQDSHLEEGQKPEMRRPTAASEVSLCWSSFINRRFMTARTAAGRRTLNVGGLLTTNVPRKPQMTSDCSKNQHS